MTDKLTTMRPITRQQLSLMLRKIADDMDRGHIPWDAEAICYAESVTKPGYGYGMNHTRLEIRWLDVQPVLTEIAAREGLWYLDRASELAE